MKELKEKAARAVKNTKRKAKEAKRQGVITKKAAILKAKN